MSTPWQNLRRAGRVARSDAVVVQDEEGDLTLTVRWPEERAPCGVVVFCHGLGSSRAGYGGLATVWAAHGYVVIQPTFPDAIHRVAAQYPEAGRDPGNWMHDPALRALMHGILHDPAYWLHRTRIVRRVMDGLADILRQTSGEAEVPCVIAGHSFGAHTAQLLAGAEIDLPGEGPRRFRDRRFGAAILLSGQGRDQQGLRERSWDGITCPVLTVTGTKDGGAKGQDWHWKCEPYDLSPPGGQYLLVLEGADHFLGGFDAEEPEATAPQQALRAATLAFLDGYLKRDAAARSWLALVEDRIGEVPVLFRAK